MENGIPVPVMEDADSSVIARDCQQDMSSKWTRRFFHMLVLLLLFFFPKIASCKLAPSISTSSLPYSLNIKPTRNAFHLVMTSEGLSMLFAPHFPGN